MKKPTRTAAVLAVLAVPALLAATAAGQTADPSPTYQTVRDSGPSANRVDLVFVGDGYTAGELDTTYAGHVDEMVDYLFGRHLNDPYPRYANFFNVHRVEVESQQSGADDPANEVVRDTALRASYAWNGGPDRLLYFNTSLANQAVSTALQGSGVDVDMRVGVVNSAKYGGGGGQWGVYAGGNGSARDVAVHEVGHSFAGLQDEYTYGGPADYTGPERSWWVNVSTDPQAKWGQWYGYDDPFHDGTARPDPDGVARGTFDVSAVGGYEGGYYSETGVFRPTQDSMMRSLRKPLNAVGREATILEIYDHVDPIDGFTPNDSIVNGDSELTVEVIDADVILVDWLVDGVLVAGDFGGTFSLTDFGYAAGEYEVTAVAYDGIVPMAFGGLDLDWVRRDLDKLQQRVSWQVVLVPEPAALSLVAAAGVLMLARRRG